MVARSEALHLWVPQTLIELAERQARSGFIRSKEDSQKSLERRHQVELWYAITIRAYQKSGEFADTTYIRRPYYERLDWQFQEFLDILATAAGSPPYYPDFPTSSFSNIAVYVIDEELLKREPREVMAELLCYRTTAADKQRAR